MGIREELEAGQRQLARNVRAMVVAQLTSWRAVPHAALLAEGGEHLDSVLRRTYTEGLWKVAPLLHVDCSTGSIVTRGGGEVGDDLLCAQLPGGEESWRLDATLVLENLGQVHRERPHVSGRDEILLEWQKRTSARYHLCPVWGAHRDPSLGLSQQAETYQKLLTEWHGDLESLWRAAGQL